MLSRRHFTLAATGSALIAGFSTVQAQSAGKIILGQSAAYTGPSGAMGIEFYTGAKIAFDQANALGGINRQTVEIRQLDDGYEPVRCAENTRKLIESGVFALFGFFGTATSLAALPMAKKEGLPFIAPFTGAVALRDPADRLTFHLRASYHDETALIVRTLLNLDIKKIAVFYQNDGYGKTGLNGIKLALNAQKLNIVAEDTFERNTVDVTKAVNTLLAAQPQTIVQIGKHKACAEFIRQAKKNGYRGTFYNVSNVDTRGLAEELGKQGEGVQVTQVVPSPYNLSQPVTREFAAAVRAAGGNANANFSSMEGYLAATLFLEGLKRAGPKATRESFVSGMESIGTQSLGGFGVVLTPTSRVASKFVELSMLSGDGRVRT